MKKSILVFCALSAAAGVLAAGLDLQSRVMLKRAAIEKGLKNSDKHSRKESRLHAGASRGDDAVMALVSLNDGYTATDLEAAGMHVTTVRGGIAVAVLPADSVESWATLPAVRKMSVQRELRPMLDRARANAGVDAVHVGETLDVPYTGKGVIAGIVDQGIDPNNISFFDSEGRNRVKYLTCFDGTADKNGSPNYDLYGEEIYDVDDKGNTFWYPTIDKFTTDDLSAYHGTHTMNILAGSYKGDVEVTMPGAGAAETLPNPYYGVATEAELAVSCGYLADACIAMGLNGILDYAAYGRYYYNMPSVMSLSLGSSLGAHDPNGLMNRFLAECGKESIVVLSAGNEGDLKIALRKELAEDDNSLATMIYPYYYRYDPQGGDGKDNTYIRQDAVMVYSSDKRPFTLRAFIMTGEPGNYRKRATLDITGEEGNYFCSDALYTNYVGGVVNNTVARYFDGFIGGGSMYDPDLGRYYGVVDYYLYTKPETGINEDGSEGVIIGFEVIGEDGQRIECYCEGYNTWMYNYGMDGYMDGQRDGTISDMAVGGNVLVVGAYTLRNRWTALNGTEFGYEESDGFVVDDIGQYSAYATMPDGSTLPHVCAPGSAVISAMSRPYVENYFKGYEQYIPGNMQAKATVDGKDYYWKQETGTSMSTPFVAGAIALWLEADPELTFEDVLDVIRATSRRDSYVEAGNPVQWGSGKFDALAGLKEVIRRRANQSGIHGISLEGRNDRLIMTPAGPGLFDVFVGEAPALDVRVYSTSGATVYSAGFDGCEATLDLSALSRGVYVVSVNGHSKKISL